jgi:hypothetical protein
MKYLLMFCASRDEESTRAGVRRSGSPQAIAAYYRTRGEWFQANAAHLRGGHELQPQAATTVRSGDGGRAVVTDGPFAEGNEVVGGFAVVEAADLDAGLALAKAWPGETVEIRPIVEG